MVMQQVMRISYFCGVFHRYGNRNVGLDFEKNVFVNIPNFVLDRQSCSQNDFQRHFRVKAGNIAIVYRIRVC